MQALGALLDGELHVGAGQFVHALRCGDLTIHETDALRVVNAEWSIGASTSGIVVTNTDLKAAAKDFLLTNGATAEAIKTK